MAKWPTYWRERTQGAQYLDPTRIAACPFCGEKEAVSYATQYISYDYAVQYHIACLSCGAHTDAYISLEAALEVWNRRVIGLPLLKERNELTNLRHEVVRLRSENEWLKRREAEREAEAAAIPVPREARQTLACFAGGGSGLMCEAECCGPKFIVAQYGPASQCPICHTRWRLVMDPHVRIEAGTPDRKKGVVE